MSSSTHRREGELELGLQGDLSFGSFPAVLASGEGVFLSEAMAKPMPLNLAAAGSPLLACRRPDRGGRGGDRSCCLDQPVFSSRYFLASRTPLAFVIPRKL